MCKKQIILLGAGGHCRSCIDIIEMQKLFTIAGIVERKEYSGTSPVSGYRVLGHDSELPDLSRRFNHAFITVGYMGAAGIRKRLYSLLVKLGFSIPVIVSPRAYVSKHAQLGRGTIVMHDACVNAGAVIGENCIINTKALVEHDVVIGDNTHVSTSAVVNGASKIGSGCFLGSNSTVVNGITLPDNNFFRAGALIRNGKDGKYIKEV